jgi:SAM-dependent MidA family methyltransferase
MSLRARLEVLIREEGPLRVDRYMQLCLHDPDDGYYAVRPALGADGDFITAPLVSQMFGELLGLWAAQVWADAGAPSAVRVVEMGPGDGTLLADALRAAGRAAPAFAAALDLWLVETSPPLRERQRMALGPHAARWAEQLDEVPGGAPLILIANELLDCLPARQFLRDADGRWGERRVGLDGAGRLAFGLSPAPRDFAPPPGLEDVAPGVVVEVSPAQAALGAEIGARITRDGGAALLIDYGRDRPEPGDTLQALRGHRKVDPLDAPGAADLTVHADFPAVLAAARQAGASTALLAQGEFLRRLGVEARAAALAAARPDRAKTLARQVHRLTDPMEMGALFKAAAIFSGPAPPPAFTADDRVLG